MSDKPNGEQEPSRGKPDGSVYAAEMKALGERNEAAHRAGRTRRDERETAQAASRRAEEVRHTKDLQSRHTPRGASQRD